MPIFDDRPTSTKGGTYTYEYLAVREARLSRGNSLLIFMLEEKGDSSLLPVILILYEH